MSGPLLPRSWDQLAARVPGVTGPVRRYLEQLACVLRPRSVVNTDGALRCFATFLAEAAPAWRRSPARTWRHSSLAGGGRPQALSGRLLAA